jgi:hypothetical protein
MNKATLAKWLLTVPVIGAWVNMLLWNNATEIIDQTAWSINSALQVWNSMMNPLFSSVVWWASAWLLTNSILKEFDWMKSHEKTRWALSWLATFAWYSAWTVAAPYLAAGWLAYAVWKYGWKPSKELVKRTWWAAWGLTWWLVKWMAVWAFNSIKSWVKWQQKINPVIS